MSKSNVNLSKESIEGAVQQGATSISQVYKMLGGTGNVSGSTTKKIRLLMPDIQIQLEANKASKPATEQPGVPTKASSPATPTTKPTKAVKPTTPKKQPKTPKPAKKGKYPRHPQNPYRELSSYGIAFDILASKKGGISRDELTNLLSRETGKPVKNAGYDLSVVLSAKDSVTGERHKSARDGYWVKREFHHYTLMLS